MKEVLKNYPELTENAIEAAKRAGLKPFLKPIRGGTDGSRLTFQGCRRRTFSRAGKLSQQAGVQFASRAGEDD